MARPIIVPTLALLVLLVSCSGARGPVQAESLLDGSDLKPPTLSPEARDRLEQNLAEARAAFDADPTDEQAIIWYGRRLAYLGRYREAIDVFSRGVELHPQSPRLLRHRGHRYISVREFGNAKRDLQRAAALLSELSIPDEIEPDGAPNAAGIPRSTLYSNIYYHWALAHYLTGGFARAADIWQTGFERTDTNDDMRVASLYWIYNSNLRAGRLDLASAALRPVRPEMDIIENTLYHELLLLYKGLRTESELRDSMALGQGSYPTTMYGVAIHRLSTGDSGGFKVILRSIVSQRDSWASFGFIAAEADLAREAR